MQSTQPRTRKDPRRNAKKPSFRLIELVRTLALAILPYGRSIAHDANGNILVNDPTFSWDARDRFRRRVNEVLQELLALTARMNPRNIGHAAFARLRPRKPRPQTPNATQPSNATPNDLANATPQPRRKRTPRIKPFPRRPATLLSPRRIAHRLEKLLAELEAVSQESGYPLPKDVQKLCARARAMAGCNTLLQERIADITKNLQTPPPPRHHHAPHTQPPPLKRLTATV